jgi:hypothetical protein
MSSFATIKPLKYQLNQGRLEPKEQTPVKSLLHLFKGGCDLGSEIKIHWCDPFSRRSAMVLANKERRVHPEERYNNPKPCTSIGSNTTSDNDDYVNWFRGGRVLLVKVQSSKE